MPDLLYKSLTAVELFSADDAARYNQWHTDLWHRLIQVHHTVLTLEQLENYRLDLISTPSEIVFWRTMVQNSWHAVVTTLHGLVNDKTKNSLTLVRQKNALMKFEWLVPEAKQELREELQRVGFDDRAAGLRQKTKKLRHSYFAHRFFDPETGDVAVPVVTFNLKELREIFDLVEEFFQVCSVGSHYQTTLSSYAPASYSYSAKGATSRPNEPLGVETILDSVARNSYFVNDPERHGVHWPSHRNLMKAEDLTALNELREKVGLPRA